MAGVRPPADRWALFPALTFRRPSYLIVGYQFTSFSFQRKENDSFFLVEISKPGARELNLMSKGPSSTPPSNFCERRRVSKVPETTVS